MKTECFVLGVGVRQGCVMSSWWFSIYMDRMMSEMNVKTNGDGAQLVVQGDKRGRVSACLHSDDSTVC